MKKRKNLIIALIAVIAVGALVCVGLTLMKDGGSGSERRFISGFGILLCKNGGGLGQRRRQRVPGGQWEDRLPRRGDSQPDGG